jgi:EAL domain-containing protein (putative c-di-GMP-specific phosphodiesterase class I)
MQLLSSRSSPSPLAAALRGPDAITLEPIVATDGSVVAFEALARFTHYPPLVVFAAAEAAGRSRIAEVRALRVALRALPLLPADARLSVNLGAIALCAPGVLDELLPVAGRLWVEVTEFRRTGEDAIRALRELQSAGAVIAVDDAGQGFGTADRIHELQPEVVKIDRTVTWRMVDGTASVEDWALLAAARACGAVVVAEGVETPAMLDAVRALGIPLAQGWTFGRQPAIAI